MAVTGVSPALRKPLLSEVGRIVNSEVLRGSESLCQLLEYLATHSVGETGSSVKEYQIAREVFGRPADFDPRLDSTVRVQTSRLRAKLSEYYAGPGALDPVVVELPRGAYSVTVHTREAAADALLTRTPIAPPLVQRLVEPPPGSQSAHYKAAVWTLAIFCVGLLISVVYLWRGAKTSSAEVRPEIPPSIKAFWRGFIDAPDRPIVVFSNAEFVGRPETGLRYLDPRKDKGGEIFDHYTGIGEVMAVHLLDQLFAQFRHGLIVKRGRLLAMDDVKGNDLIFIGSPSENLTLRDLPAMQEFQFRRPDSGPRKGDLGIFNLHPSAGEQTNYFASSGLPLKEDYALIGLMPGPNRQHWVMTLAGISTIGTQAAVEYVCNETSVEQLLKGVRQTGSSTLPLEAVIRVTVSRGVPVSSQLVAVHMRTP